MRPKNSENGKNAPEIVRKGRNRVRFGCWRGVQQVRTGEKTRNPNQSEPKNHTTHEKRKPAETQCFCRFLAGAEGLEPSARGFGVDVGERTREREMGGVARFLPQVRERAVLVWCCEKISGAKTGKKQVGKPAWVPSKFAGE